MDFGSDTLVHPEVGRFLRTAPPRVQARRALANLYTVAFWSRFSMRSVAPFELLLKHGLDWFMSTCILACWQDASIDLTTSEAFRSNSGIVLRDCQSTGLRRLGRQSGLDMQFTSPAHSERDRCATLCVHWCV